MEPELFLIFCAASIGFAVYAKLRVHWRLQERYEASVSDLTESFGSGTVIGMNANVCSCCCFLPSLICFYDAALILESSLHSRWRAAGRALALEQAAGAAPNAFG